MKANGDRMSEGLLQKIRISNRCNELVFRISADEQKRYGMDIYADLTDFLSGDTESFVEQHYIGIGAQRAQLGVPFSDLFWAVSISRDYLWEYIQQECLLDEQVDFWGGVILLRSLDRFFDRALYFTIVGYQKAARDTRAGASAIPA
jgi:hypothetical protein